MIELLHDYAGRNSNERRIWPGVYAEDDERLFGLADYLVENGHARRLSETTTTATFSGDKNVYAVVEFSADSGAQASWTLSHDEAMDALGRTMTEATWSVPLSAEQVQVLFEASASVPVDPDSDLAALAAAPDVQRENATIEAEFASAESDGLDDSAAPSTYDGYTVADLRAECERRGIDIATLEGSGANGNLLRADLIAILAGDDADQE